MYDCGVVAECNGRVKKSRTSRLVSMYHQTQIICSTFALALERGGLLDLGRVGFAACGMGGKQAAFCTCAVTVAAWQAWPSIDDQRASGPLFPLQPLRYPPRQPRHSSGTWGMTKKKLEAP